MSARHLYTTVALLGIGIAAAGCDRSCQVADPVTPGCGVEIADGTVRIGDERADVEALLGTAAIASDMDALGTRFSYLPARPLSGFYDPEFSRASSLLLGDGFDGSTADGIGIGSAQDDVQSAFGEPAIDPFLGIWWYRSAGIGFELSDGAVSGIAIFSPDV